MRQILVLSSVFFVCYILYCRLVIQQTLLSDITSLCGEPLPLCSDIIKCLPSNLSIHSSLNLVVSRVDYCNTVLAGASKVTITVVSDAHMKY